MPKKKAKSKPTTVNSRKPARSRSPLCSLADSRMTPEQEVDFILGVTECEVTPEQRETMLKMAHFDNQRIEEEYGGMY